jgi:hypothetical protein
VTYVPIVADDGIPVNTATPPGGRGTVASEVRRGAMEHLPDPIRQYLLWWLALVVAPALVMIIIPSSARSMRRFIRMVTKVWLLPVTLTVRFIVRWLREK